MANGAEQPSQLPGGVEVTGELSRQELLQVSQRVVRSVLSPGAGEGPTQRDEIMYAEALVEVLSSLLTLIKNAVSGSNDIQLLTAAFVGRPPAASRQETLELISLGLQSLFVGAAAQP